MIKQLYRLKFSRFLKLAAVSMFALLLASCGDDGAQDQVASAEASQASAETPETPAEAPEEVQTAAAEVADVMEEVAQEAQENAEDVVAAAEDAGFINYDMVLGDPNAPVEIIEYASITCNHCATFHNNVLPRLKENYVDSGKVKIVTRSFLLNGIDLQGTAISRCIAPQRYFRFMDALFERQTQWYDVNEFQRLNGLHDQQTAGQMFVAHSVGEISKIARQLGLNQARIDECIASEEIGEYIVSIYNEGRTLHKVTATPTILVNGNKTAGNDYASVERAIEAALD